MESQSIHHKQKFYAMFNSVFRIPLMIRSESCSCIGLN